jgi:hypothetical protein
MTVEIRYAKRAVRQIAAAALWWHENRPLAPMLFERGSAARWHAHPYALSSIAHVAFTYLDDTPRGIEAIATLARLFSDRDVVAEVALSLEAMLAVTNPSARAELLRTIDPYADKFRDDYRRLWLERTKR